MSYYNFLDVADELSAVGFVIDQVNRYEFEALRDGVLYRVIRYATGVDVLSATGESMFAVKSPASVVAFMTARRAA